MSDLITRLRAMQLPGAESDLTVMCAEAADRLEQIRGLVEAVRDANAAASRGMLLTPGQEAAWSRLMEAL